MRVKQMMKMAMNIFVLVATFSIRAQANEIATLAKLRTYSIDELRDRSTRGIILKDLKSLSPAVRKELLSNELLAARSLEQILEEAKLELETLRNEFKNDPHHFRYKKLGPVLIMLSATSGIVTGLTAGIMLTEYGFAFTESKVAVGLFGLSVAFFALSYYYQQHGSEEIFLKEQQLSFLELRVNQALESLNKSKEFLLLLQEYPF